VLLIRESGVGKVGAVLRISVSVSCCVSKLALACGTTPQHF